MRRLWFGALSVLVLLAVVVAPTAAASPQAPTVGTVWKCRAWKGSNPHETYAMCKFGTGGVRAWANCDADSGDSQVGGLWVRAGQISTANCGLDAFAYNPRYHAF